MNYRLQCVCRGRVRFETDSPERAREMTDRFNRDHEGCAPGADRWRCGACGILLLHKDRCPSHRGSIRIVWPAQLGLAYTAVVEAHAAGRRPVAPAAEGLVYSQAVELAKRWGLRPAGETRVERRGEVAS